MIEDVAALDQIEAIAAVEGIDAFFIGRGDLTAALGSASPTSPETRAVVEPITAAARSAAMPIMVLAASRADGVAMAGLGATAFVVSNDQNLMKQAAEKALKDFAAPMT
jgi:2-keto-3-deoxy-L-rhamnonate aldolase RhmA